MSYRVTLVLNGAHDNATTTPMTAATADVARYFGCSQFIFNGLNTWNGKQYLTGQKSMRKGEQDIGDDFI